MLFHISAQHDHTTCNMVLHGPESMKTTQAWIEGNDSVKVIGAWGYPVSHRSFAVVEADAVVKRQTAASSYKPAILERKIKTSVPPFIEVGDIVIISTHDSSYVEKAKK